MEHILSRGRCVGSGQHDLFFSERPDELAAAQVLCRECPVRVACLEVALSHGYDWGVWGGVIFWDGEIFHRKRGRGRPRRGDALIPVQARREELIDLVRSA